jgi:hypothetical protein
VRNLEPFCCVTGEHRVLRVLVAGEDPTLLRAVVQFISCRRPQWLVDGVVGREDARARLLAEPSDVVVCLEVDGPAGGETLGTARTACPTAIRIACCRVPSEHPEVVRASECVVGSTTADRLVSALDRAMYTMNSGLPGEAPPVASA